LLNTSQQIGGAFGVAIVSTIFVSKAKAGHFTPQAYTTGYHWAFGALVAFAAVGAVLAFIFFRGAHVPQEGVEEAPVVA
jgi:amino acid transporter